MSIDRLIGELSSGLAPVRRRRPGVEAAVLAGLIAAELALLVGLGAVRPDMQAAIHRPSFWWKLASLGCIAVLGTGVTLASFDPARSPRRGVRVLLALVLLCLVVGWGVDAAGHGGPDLLARLDWRGGCQCAWEMAALSVPAVLGLGVMMKRGAPADTGATALAAGIAGAAWGGFVFVFACPSDDPLYIAVWYAVGCGLVALLVRAVLPRLTGW